LSLQDSFAVDPDTNSLGNDDWRDMAINWINIEEDKDMIEEEIDEVLEGWNENMEELEEEEQIDIMEMDPLPKITKSEALQWLY
jgi:uncharacterized protein YuzB (UPF0349 family)